MLEFCAAAPSLGQLRTCLAIYEDSWWAGMGVGFGIGFGTLLGMILVSIWIRENF